MHLCRCTGKAEVATGLAGVREPGDILLPSMSQKNWLFFLGHRIFKCSTGFLFGSLTVTLLPCASRLCCPPGVGSTRSWTTLTWWSAATCPAFPRGRRRDTSSARWNSHSCWPRRRCDATPSLQADFFFALLCRLVAVGHAEVLHRVRDQWPDRKRTDAEGDDHAALR